MKINIVNAFRYNLSTYYYYVQRLWELNENRIFQSETFINHKKRCQRWPFTLLKLLKMAKGIRALLDTVMQALPQVGNLGLLFFLLFFIFAALGVELFGRLECSDEHSCQGLGEHAHFGNFGMAFLTLFRVATGDNWNGIMKDALREDCDNSADCVKNCCVADGIAPMFFVIFVLMAQFVLVNVVVAVLMKHLEESHKQMEDEMDMEDQLEREMAAEEEEQLVQMALDHEYSIQNPLCKEFSLPADFTFKSLPPSPLYQSQGRRFSFNSWSGRMTEPTIVPSQRRRQTVQESNMLVPPALMPTFMIKSLKTFKYAELGTTKKVVWNLKTALKLETLKYF